VKAKEELPRFVSCSFFAPWSVFFRLIDADSFLPVAPLNSLRGLVLIFQFSPLFLTFRSQMFSASPFRDSPLCCPPFDSSAPIPPLHPTVSVDSCDGFHPSRYAPSLLCFFPLFPEKAFAPPLIGINPASNSRSLVRHCGHFCSFAGILFLLFSPSTSHYSPPQTGCRPAFIFSPGGNMRDCNVSFCSRAVVADSFHRAFRCLWFFFFQRLMPPLPLRCLLPIACINLLFLVEYLGALGSFFPYSSTSFSRFLRVV